MVMFVFLFTLLVYFLSISYLPLFNLLNFTSTSSRGYLTFFYRVIERQHKRRYFGTEELLDHRCSISSPAVNAQYRISKGSFTLSLFSTRFATVTGKFGLSIGFRYNV